jgi:energy-coupling factor transporter transmembrane protein EcfT
VCRLTTDTFVRADEREMRAWLSRGPHLTVTEWAEMSLKGKALLSMAFGIAAAAAIATLTTTVADIVRGVAGLVTIVVLTRAVMTFAAEPGEARKRSGRAR